MNAVLTASNQEWALDFVADGVASGRGIRILTVVAGFTRESPAIEVGVSLGSRRVTRVLERVIAERGAPKRLRCDNGPEFTNRHFLAWCGERGITVVHTQPGRRDITNQFSEIPQSSESGVLGVLCFSLLLDGSADFVFGAQPVLEFGAGVAAALDVELIRTEADSLFQR